MKTKLSMFLIIAALCLMGIWPPGWPNRTIKQIPAPSQPPVNEVVLGCM